MIAQNYFKYIFQKTISNTYFKKLFHVKEINCIYIRITSSHVSLKTLPVTFGIAFFAVAIISASALTDASALMDDGTLTKYSPNGHYKVEMSWEPAGEIVPGQNYDFTFTISNSLTEKRLQVSNFDLGVVQNDVLVTDRSINAAGTVKEEFLFLQAGITHILLSDINGSGQEVNFTFLADRPNAINSSDGVQFVKKESAEPQMYFCGWEKNKKTLGDCFETETYENYGWYGKVNVLIYAPGWNFDENQIEFIGDGSDGKGIVTFHSRSEYGFSEYNGSGCGLVETGPNTGLFMGRLKLTGHDYDLNGDGVVDTKLGGEKCSAPKSPYKELGKLEGGRDGAFTVNWQYATEPEDKFITKTATFGWNLATIDILKDEYSVNDTVKFKFYDKESYGLGKDKMSLSFKVYSDSDQAGIDISSTQHGNYKYKKAFEFNLTSTNESSGETLYVKPGDKIYVEFEDYTLPEDVEGKIGGPYQKGDHLDIIDVATITN